jgi:large subunit ribosomal protein L31
MKKGFHPKYGDCTIKCACGNTIKTRATVSKLDIEICSACHPFYTGKKKIVDSAGQVDRFLKRYQKSKSLKQKGGKQKGKKNSIKKKSKEKIIKK